MICIFLFGDVWLMDNFSRFDRKGAPFRHKMDKLKLQLGEGGFISFWLDELIEASGRKARIRRNQRKQGENGEELQEGEKYMEEGKTNEVMVSRILMFSCLSVNKPCSAQVSQV